MSGFRDEDDNFDDLLTRSGGLGGHSTLFTTTGGSSGDEEDLDSNPFADLRSTLQMLEHSNSTYLPPAAPSGFDRSPPLSPVSASDGHLGAFGSTTRMRRTSDGPSSSQQTPSYAFSTGHGYTGATPSRSTFTRENAPEPETPSYSSTYDPSQYNDDELVRSTTTTIGATTALFGDSQDIQYDSLAFNDSTGPQSPFQSSYSPPPQSVMVPVEEQTPFGSPPPLSPLRLPVSGVFHLDPTVTSASSSFDPSTTHRPLTRKPDLSSLLGEEKPILPSFKKSTPSASASSKRAEGVAGPLGSKIAVLPVSSIGRRTVPGALATLLGLEVEEDDERGVRPKFEKKGPARKPATTPVVPPTMTTTANKTVEDQKPAQTIESTEQQTDKVSSNSASLSKHFTEPVVAPVEPEPAPIPPESTESIPPLSPTILETNLPESRPETPQQPLTSTDHDSATTTVNSQPLKAISRMSSQAASMRSVASNDADHEDKEGRTKYDSIVSPMDTGDVNGAETNANAWPSNKSGEGVNNLEERLEALRVETEETGTSEDRNRASTDSKMQDVDTAMDPAFAQYIFQERPVDTEGQEQEQEQEQDRGGASIGHASGASEEANSVRGTYSRSVVTGDEDVNGSEPVSGLEPTSSPPLPPVPKLSSPTRSSHAGGSLGPSFLITVGDPQKIGNPLNPAAQHTVYTVRTRTTSSVFRKSDFSVLRRFSHFLWLYDALTINNPGVIVPGMPEKSAMGRFGSEFVENRRQGLQAALMKIVAHPMLVGDPDLRLFLESDSFSVDIKQRKLDVPSESKGFLASLGSAISGPSFVEFDDYFDERRHQLEAFEIALRTLITSLSNASKVRHSVQDSLAELQTSLAGLASCDLSKSLRGAIEAASCVQQRLFEIGERHLASDEQVGALINVAEMYARLCASARGVFGARIKAFHSWQVAEAGLKKSRAAHEKAKRNGRGMDTNLGLAVAEVSDEGHLRLIMGDQAERKALDAKQDFEDVSKLTKAEMARFDKEKIDDFKKAIEAYADGMAERQREVVFVWQEYYELLQGMVQQQQAGSMGLPAVEEQ